MEKKDEVSKLELGMKESFDDGVVTKSISLGN
jgi:hypothetical protein